jgi:DNA (cytosine-5)-methyltransferase 1
LFSAIGLLIEHCRPRIIIFEQTSGLYRIAQHKPVFESYIREITSTGYSARWTVLNAAHAGGVHARKRLHIIASCPGEPLPPFPEPTHGAPPLAPLMTIAKCLAMLPDDQPPHMRESRPRKGIPYDPHTVLRHCITTNGGQGDLHPCGSRSFSAQELAAMAGFPPWHRFPRTNLGRLRRLIGNAVVYEMHKAILQEVLRSMRMWDKRVLAWRPEGEPMVID